MVFGLTLCCLITAALLSVTMSPALAQQAVVPPASEDGASAAREDRQDVEAKGPAPAAGDDAETSAKDASVAEEPVKSQIVVRSWAGAYGQAQDQAIIKPLARDLGFEIERQTHAGAAERFEAVDVAELDQLSLRAACRAGQLVKMSALMTTEELDREFSVRGGSDFVAGSVSDCGVPTFAWSSMLIANGEAMKKLAKRRYRPANRLAHLLDVKRYPGKRALIRSPKRLLEMMLMGSGVGRDEVYEQLATRQGRDAAFRALDQLSKHILWVDGPREALIALDRGDVTIAMTYSGRAFRRLIASRLRPIWDGHVIDFASWAVPSSSQNRDMAKRFILAATSAESLAAQARLWPYGPMRRSALPLARRHDLLDTDLEAFMPTSELRLAQGLILDAAFWDEHGEALQVRFQDWLDGVPLGIRVPPPVKAPPPPIPPLPRLVERPEAPPQ